MKLRKWFVSNSSSCSFICDVCGADQSGMDLSLDDAEMYQCENDHTFCDEHLLQDPQEMSTEQRKEKLLKSDYEDDESKKRIEKMTNEEIDEYWENEYDRTEDRYEIPTIFCPICQFKKIEPHDGLAYLKKIHKITDDVLLKELKDKFESYDKFLDFIVEKQDKKTS